MSSVRASAVSASVLVLVLGFAPSAAAGVPVPPVTNQQVEATLEGAPRTIRLAAPPLFYVAAPQANVAAGGPAFRVGSIAFNGNAAVGADALRGQVADLVGANATYADLVTAAQKLTRFYQGRGFPFATVVAPAQKGEGGVARFEVQEGKLGKIKVEGNSGYTVEAIRYALVGSLQPGQPVTRDGLEAALLRLNAMPGLQATAVPAPGAPGETDLIIKVVDQGFGFRFTPDNHGREDVGLRRATFEMRFLSPSGWGDELTLKAVGAESAGTRHRAIGYSVPMTAAGTRVALSYSETDFDVVDPAYQAFDFSGETSNLRLDLLVPLAQSRLDSSTLALSLKRTEAEMTAGPTVIGSSAYMLASVGVRAEGANADSSYWSRDISFASNFRADGDGSEDDAVLGRLEVDLMSNRPLAGPDSRVEARFRGVYSFDPAIDMERFSIGGPNDVRAYQSAEVYGDGGFTTSVEYQRWAGSGGFRGAFVMFADAGYIANLDAPGVTQTNGPWIAGVGMGFRFGGRNFYGAFEYGVPVGNRDSADGDRDRVWMSVSIAL